MVRSKNKIFIILLLGILLCLLLLKKEPFTQNVSYAYPFGGKTDWIPANWWKKWSHRGEWDNIIKPVCPSGCVYTGYTADMPSGYVCSNRGSGYGQWTCKYDTDCEGCRWQINGNDGESLF